ncbi:hypothetical protein ALO42_200050 [Pseudomonas syringae pv. atrofaciens]|nr:DNA topoisomerase III [Pseudomonas syringae BRIP34876]ELQ02594.1 DNA topoisomerase III [Pseudomonas syringae BRIP34881]KPW10683.1 hypothetical protein ALO42_200050 [Pseudomonas syringae pv. atrofaciens]OBS32184.1 DNA topoisomerase III [Pseudomonas syringae pv. syringae]
MPPYSDKTRGDGGIKGNGVAVTWGIGHVLETAPSDAYGEHLKNWSLETLPILPKQWKVLVKPTEAEREGEMSAQADQVSWVMTASYVTMQAQHSIFCQKKRPVHKHSLGTGRSSFYIAVCRCPISCQAAA